MAKVFGREDILAILEKRLDGFKNGYRQNIALIGAAGLGKTSVLKELLLNINRSQILPVFIEFKNHNLARIIRVFISQILRNFLLLQGIGEIEEFARLTDKSQAFLPKTTAKIKSIEHNIEKDKAAAALLEAFDLAQIFSEESGISCLIILDEFHNIGDFQDKEIFTELGKKIPTQKNIMYLLTSSAVVTAREILSHGLSLLFGNFEVIELKPYNIQTSTDFIKSNLRTDLNDTYVKFLIYITGGHPFYLDIFCRELSRQAGASNTNLVTEDEFIKAFETLLFEDWGILYQKFSGLLDGISSDKQREDYVAILSSIISGYNKTKAIAEHLNKKEKTIQQKAQCLYESGIAVKNADFLCLKDKLFAFWIDVTYGAPCACLNEDILRNYFRNKVALMLKEFFVGLEKNVTEKIIGLFALFSNETVEFERKKFTLSRFKEIKPLSAKINGFDALISACAYDNTWIIAVKNGALSEKDVSEFINECKKYKNRPAQRKIIISLNKVDANAKLKALEEKITTWDTGEINSLFEMYNQPIIFTY